MNKLMQFMLIALLSSVGLQGREPEEFGTGDERGGSPSTSARGQRERFEEEQKLREQQRGSVGGGSGRGRSGSLGSGGSRSQGENPVGRRRSYSAGSGAGLRETTAEEIYNRQVFNNNGDFQLGETATVQPIQRVSRTNGLRRFFSESVGSIAGRIRKMKKPQFYTTWVRIERVLGLRGVDWSGNFDRMVDAPFRVARRLKDFGSWLAKAPGRVVVTVRKQVGKIRFRRGTEVVEIEATDVVGMSPEAREEILDGVSVGSLEVSSAKEEEGQNFDNQVNDLMKVGFFKDEATRYAQLANKPTRDDNEEREFKTLEVLKRDLSNTQEFIQDQGFSAKEYTDYMTVTRQYNLGKKISSRERKRLNAYRDRLGLSEVS